MARPIPIDQLPVLDSNESDFPEKEIFLNGVAIPVDKPNGWSSFDVVKFVRNRIQVKKVGHAGTLDPLATGLLILCCGKATKSISQFQELPKTYIAEITFGAATPSYDAASKISEQSEWEHISQPTLMNTIQEQFTGVFAQVPPVFSALWKDGVRLYELARKGIAVEPEPRQVVVHNIELLEFDLPIVRLKIECGKGFYVRSLANDLGKALGSNGYLSSLRRTEIGDFTVQTAWQTDQFHNWSKNG
jgi:tRNA pseudouridine55 synthase